MKSNKLLILLMVLTVAVALGVLWRNFATPKVSLRPSAAVGEILAAEVGRVLGGTGKVAVISRPPLPGAADANRQRIESFESAIKQHASLQLAAPVWLPRPPVGTMDLGEASAEQLLAAFDKTPDARAFLILTGMPPFSPAVVEKVNARSLRLIAVCGYSANLKRWLESKAVAVAVIPRFGELPAGTQPPTTPKDWFDQEYQMITPETLSQLPY